MKSAKRVKDLSIVEKIALKNETSTRYVNKIISGERKPIRGKGILIANDIEAANIALDSALQS